MITQTVKWATSILDMGPTLLLFVFLFLFLFNILNLIQEFEYLLLISLERGKNRVYIGWNETYMCRSSYERAPNSPVTIGQ